MLDVQILGSGCNRCEVMYNNAVAAAENIPEVSVTKVTDPEIFFKMKVYMTPALVINNEVVVMGKVLEPSEIETEMRKRLGAAS